MVNKNRFESLRCSECDQPFHRGVYDEETRCNACVCAKYHDVFHYSINLDNQLRTILLGCVLAAFLGLMSTSRAMAEPISDEVAYKCLAGEAVGEGIVGLQAIGEVLRTRGKTQGMYGCQSNLWDRTPEYVKRVVREAWRNSKSSHIVEGADHFEAVGRFGTPSWAGSMTKITTIKNHTFYKSK